MKRMASITLCFLLLFSLLPIALAHNSTTKLNDATEVTNLKVNYQENPIGIEQDRIKFSWMLSSNVVGLSQEAYQIVVTDSVGETVWDSGVVKDSRSVGIPYGGPELELESRYFWDVKPELFITASQMF